MEILVVVAIISLIASSILLNTSFNRPQDRLEAHTEKLAKTLTLLLQEAILNDANYALGLIPEGYLVLQYDGEEWGIPADRFLGSLKTTHSFDDELVIDQQLVAAAAADDPKPHILLLASGEMTPFEWAVRDRENELASTLRADLIGRIEIDPTAQGLQ